MCVCVCVRTMLRVNQSTSPCAACLVSPRPRHAERRRPLFWGGYLPVVCTLAPIIIVRARRSLCGLPCDSLETAVVEEFYHRPPTKGEMNEVFNCMVSAVGRPIIGALERKQSIGSNSVRICAGG